jgi:hypothetical protein
MAFFPADPTKYRPSKVIFKVDVLHEVDRAVQEGLGGYANRHELVNDLIEQGLISLRYPEGDEPLAPMAKPQTESQAASSVSINGHGDGTGPESTDRMARPTMPSVDALGALSETRITMPKERGAVLDGGLAQVREEPMFGMHNRDAPSAWALARLGMATSAGPVSLGGFYEKTTEDAWKLAAQLAPFETQGSQKLAVMLPRNPDKPQSAAVGFQAFAMGQVARKPDENGLLVASGPFYQWSAVAIVGDVKDPQIGLTPLGWELVELFDGLDFSLPHDERTAHRFLGYLQQHAASDFWGFRTALEGAARGLGRAEINEYFHSRLTTHFSEVKWKGSVADSVASGYVSRARAWGLLEPKLYDGAYRSTAAGEKLLNEFSGTKAG